ncbi:hypothetical protein C9374_009345 [Naegleria lovaniensis]|uniref:pyridoxal 5'-phosphate synthase (glutamine hydrolyzing) n=1 Tax=Naegleria lovaniensis TaxID=51637 RepID=A0AA88GH72_NAELO|nr:uncharacterized protein C9374_009345 [Naegleria lovaniensis]KAG2377434.1 hypothetical protein C9374_009345 [Naegleria lovaniensis]
MSVSTTGIQITNMICEVKSITEALIAQQAGVAALLVVLERTPVTTSTVHGNPILMASNNTSWNVNYQLLHEIKNQFPNTAIIARIRKGHLVEAQLCEEMGIMMIDESDEMNVQVSESFVEKRNTHLTTAMTSPQVISTFTETDHHSSYMCACSDLPEALKRIHEGANMLRTRGEFWCPQKGESCTSSLLLSCVTQIKEISKSVDNIVNTLNEEQIESLASREEIPKSLLLSMRQQQQLLVPLFAYGGICCPADVALVMQMPNVSGVIIGNEIFGYDNPLKLLRCMVQAARLYKNPSLLLQLSLEFGSLQSSVRPTTPQAVQAKKLLDEKGSSQPAQQLTEHHKPIDSSHLREELSSVVANNDFM